MWKVRNVGFLKNDKKYSRLTLFKILRAYKESFKDVVQNPKIIILTLVFNKYFAWIFFYGAWKGDVVVEWLYLWMINIISLETRIWGGIPILVPNLLFYGGFSILPDLKGYYLCNL